LNLFILDNDLQKCAEAHVDSHVVKMPLEVAQILCTNFALYHIGIEAPNRKIDKDEHARLREYAQQQRPLPQEHRLVPYLPVSVNHPCTIWARSSKANWLWCVDYAFALEKEYTYRYGKPSLKAVDVIRGLGMPEFAEEDFTPFAQAMPENYKCSDAIKAYRGYYCGDKVHLAKWKNREEPSWWNAA